MSAAADGFADQAVIVPLAVAGRCVEQIDAEIERAANGGDRLHVICRTIGPRHAVTAKADGGNREVRVTELVAFHQRAPALLAFAFVSDLPSSRRLVKIAIHLQPHRLRKLGGIIGASSRRAWS